MLKFPPTDLTTFEDMSLKFNLTESTTADLLLGQIMDEALQGALTDLRLGYGSAQGQHALRCQIAEALGIDEQHILITSGSMSSIFLATFTLCGPGDEILTVTPNFPPMLNIATAVGAIRQELPLFFDDQYSLNLERFAAKLTPHTRLVVLITPHNPSGTCIPRTTIEAAIQLMEELSPQAYMLIDETYREASYGHNLVAESWAAYSPRVLTTASLSKCHGAPGIRVGWLTCLDPNVLKQLTNAKMNTTLSCSVVDETIALHILKHSTQILTERQAMLAHGFRMVEAWVERNQVYIEWVRPHAGALCCIRLRASQWCEQEVDLFYEYVRQADVQIASAQWFGEEKRVFRLGFGFLPLKALEEALGMLEHAFHTLMNQHYSASRSV